ncbi:hypothetical protein SUDANB95_02678 [Actinosynnema sp. ALI-1.44]
MTGLRRVVVVPGDATVTDVSDAGAVCVPIRAARRFDDLAAVLGARLGVPAEVSDDWSGLEPTPGIVVVCRPDGLWRLENSDALAQVVVVDMPRGEVLTRTEELGLAASVQSPDYQAWLSGRGPAAFHGRAALAASLGATTSDNPLERGTRYARLTFPHADLPAALADYLAALTASGFGRRPVS